MVCGVTACSGNDHTANSGDITSVTTSDITVTNKLSVSASDPVPSTAQTIGWMNDVNAQLGFDDDGSPHRLTMSDDTIPARISWWTEPTEDAGAHQRAAMSADTLVLSPLEHGDYVMHTICDGVGSFTVELTTDHDQTDTTRMNCTADAVTTTDVGVAVDHDDEQVSVRFIPSNATRAAAGFSLAHK